MRSLIVFVFFIIITPPQQNVGPHYTTLIQHETAAFKIFHPLEVVTRYRDPQLQVGENYSYLLNPLHSTPEYIGIRISLSTVYYMCNANMFVGEFFPHISVICWIWVVWFCSIKYTIVGFTLTVVNDFRWFFSELFSTNCHEILLAIFSNVSHIVTTLKNSLKHNVYFKI